MLFIGGSIDIVSEIGIGISCINVENADEFSFI